MKQLAAGLLGLGILAWAAAHSGPTNGDVVVHVTEPNVNVSIGGHTFHIEERRFVPIVCELPVGLHELVMTRHGLVLDRQTFELQAGANLVLTAWDRGRAGSPFRDGPEPLEREVARQFVP